MVRILETGLFLGVGSLVVFVAEGGVLFLALGLALFLVGLHARYRARGAEPAAE